MMLRSNVMRASRFQWVLRMVYNAQICCVFGLCRSLGILKTSMDPEVLVSHTHLRKEADQVSETLYSLVLEYRKMEKSKTPVILSLISVSVDPPGNSPGSSVGIGTKLRAGNYRHKGQGRPPPPGRFPVLISVRG
jgi:hypothetical protein